MGAVAEEIYPGHAHLRRLLYNIQNKIKREAVRDDGVQTVLLMGGLDSRPELFAGFQSFAFERRQINAMALSSPTEVQVLWNYQQFDMWSKSFVNVTSPGQMTVIRRGMTVRSERENVIQPFQWIRGSLSF